jgi:hypothetical protein
MCELAHFRAGAERLEYVCPSFHVRFLDADVSIRLHSTYRLWYDLTQDHDYQVNHDYPLTIPKQMKPPSLLLMAPS